MTTNDVSKSRDVSKRSVRIAQHKRVVTSGGVDDVIVGWYQVDVTCCDVEPDLRLAVPGEVRRLLQVCHVVGGLEMTFSM